MPERQAELSVYELNYFFERNRDIIQQEVPAAPISFQITPSVIGNADSLLNQTWASPAAIGSSVAAPGTFTILRSTDLVATSTNMSVSGGSLDGVPIGSSARSSGAFTLLSSTDITVHGGKINNVTIGDTARSSAAFSVLSSTAATISGGGINGTPIGSSEPALGKFNQLIAPSTVPSTSNSTGVIGEFAISTAYFYGCIAADSWARAALSTW